MKAVFVRFSWNSSTLSAKVSVLLHWFIIYYLWPFSVEPQEFTVTNAESFEVVIPLACGTNCPDLDVFLEPGTGDLDLYMSKTGPPILDGFFCDNCDCVGVHGGTVTEKCGLRDLVAGNSYFVKVTKVEKGQIGDKSTKEGWTMTVKVVVGAEVKSIGFERSEQVNQ